MKGQKVFDFAVAVAGLGVSVFALQHTRESGFWWLLMGVSVLGILWAIVDLFQE
jgi:hypothetical protein